jgi:hypothetical protein
VRQGSTAFSAYPGDYTGGLADDVVLKEDQPIYITIDQGLYLPVPDGYDAPLYDPE